MGNEAQPNNPNPAAPSGGASTATTPTIQVAPSPAVPPTDPRGSMAAPLAAPPAPPPPARRTLDGEGADLPEDGDVFEISRANMKTRLQRATSSQLRQAFGTDNVEEILAWKQQNEEFRKREEESKLAQMTEAERYKTQYERAHQEAQHWKSQYAELQEQHQLREQDRQVMGLVARHVKPRCLDYVSRELAAHLQSVDEDEMRDPQAYIDAWTKKFVDENPEFGIAQAPAPPAAAPAPMSQAAPPPRQVPLSNGTPQGRPPTAVPTGVLTNKTAAPGLPNSMTDEEYRRYKRDLGYTY